MLAVARNPPGQTRPPDNIFIRAPAIVSPEKTKIPNPATGSHTFHPAEAQTVSKTDVTKMDTCSQLQDPHIWITRSTKKESANHPNSQAQGEPRRSLLQPQH